MRLTKAERDFIEAMRVMHVATVDTDGIAHNVPVCPLLDKDNIYFASERNARKIRNIKTNSHVTAVFDEYSEAWDYLRGVMIHGTARIVSAAQFRRLRRQIYAKYPQYESKAALDERDSVIVELTPERKFSWGFE